MPQKDRPFEFLIDLRDIVSGAELAENARRAESTGYHEIVFPDHLIPQLGPISGLAWVAAATEKIRIAAFVFNNDLRHPAILAQELASLDVLSGGRLDVAIGAGWNVPEYEAIGVPFDPTPVRQARLAEAITVLKGAFGDGPFSFQGDHYTITDLDGQPKPVQKPHPPFMIGGGGRKTLELAGREAQIVSLAPRIRPDRRGDPTSITVAATAEKIEWVKAAAGDRFDDITLNVYPSQAPIVVTDHARAEVRKVADGIRPDRRGDPTSITVAATAEKIEWVKAAAGDRFDDITLNVYPSQAPIVVTDHARAEVRKVADGIRARTGVELSEDELLEAPQIFIGSVDGLVEKFRSLRERLGISSFMCGTGGDLDPVVERLAGT